jgi:hypothetical protein
MTAQTAITASETAIAVSHIFRVEPAAAMPPIGASGERS